MIVCDRSGAPTLIHLVKHAIAFRIAKDGGKSEGKVALLGGSRALQAPTFRRGVWTVAAEA